MATPNGGDPALRVAPGPKGLPIMGVLPVLGRRDLIDYYVSAWHQYGDIVRFPLGPMVSHLIIWPDDVRHVLVDNQENYIKGVGFRKVRLALGQGLFTVDGGPLWRRQRRLMQPPFTPTGVTQFAPVMSHVAQDIANGWYAHVLGGEPIDVNAEMMRLAMSIIARTMLGIAIGEQAREAARAFTFVLEYVSRHSTTLFDVPLSVPTNDNRHFKTALATLDRFVGGVIEERRTRGDGGNDLLTMLLNARDPETGEAMPLRQVRDEVLTIFFAGHETTAQALTWAWYNLSLHPEVEEKLHAELASTLGGRMPAVEDLAKLDYVKAVVDETMRLYPPVWVFVRQTLGPDQLGGYDIPAGSMVAMSQYITHRHPQLWTNPEAFDPERFLPGNDRSRPKYAYFPFGGGPRVCLGSNFALQEAYLAIAVIAQRFRLRLVPGQNIHPRMLGTLRPNGPVMMRLEPR